MKLTNVVIHKYKSIETDQSFKVENDITVLVGMNEAGKTSVLEAIAKTNYFTKDEKFVFDTTHDYPRKEKKKLDKSGDIGRAITLSFDVDEDLQIKISEDLGEQVATIKKFDYLKKYDGVGNYSSYGSVDRVKFISNKLSELGIDDEEISDKLQKCNSDSNSRKERKRFGSNEGGTSSSHKSGTGTTKKPGLRAVTRGS